MWHAIQPAGAGWLSEEGAYESSRYYDQGSNGCDSCAADHRRGLPDAPARYRLAAGGAGWPAGRHHHRPRYRHPRGGRWAGPAYGDSRAAHDSRPGRRLAGLAGRAGRAADGARADPAPASGRGRPAGRLPGIRRPRNAESRSAGWRDAGRDLAAGRDAGREASVRPLGACTAPDIPLDDRRWTTDDAAIVYRPWSIVLK